ncbi:phosphatidate cytidylyltransferase [Mesonia aestuariivivens]|uniref:Phosphatidate cytidylyltransferase n=1 Tax=Mesonia aestuariivivens TaxID=2796128 RepID=A0ABS6W1L7_9FLAO|nr:phosphatidate cytidylyltransferase [Mesonia aestuariivivens]MBW2961746.1 phosphatidate cytidylyltransferase [Mesonia aestuariivivens]
MNELLKRTLSGAFYVILLISAILFSEYSFIALFFAFGIICLYELQNLLKLNSYLNYIVLLGALFLYGILKIHDYSVLILLIITIFVKILLLKDLLIINEIPLFEGKKYILTLFYLISSIIFLTLIPYENGEYSPYILIGVFFLVWFNDSFAYLVGKNFGKRKLYERISPNKTVEGFLGGLFFAAIGSAAVAYFTKTLDYQTWLIISILVSIFGTCGDLIQSKLKRQANVKDSGTIMPGHGGLLDRLDSILFAGTFVYAYLLII